MPLSADPITASLEIDAPPAKVWELVSDPRNMTRWSPQTWKTFVLGGKKGDKSGLVAEGTKTLNINKRGALVWPTQSKIVRYTPEQEIAWRVKENYTVWSYSLEPTPAGGTRLTGKREAPQGISDLSVRLTKAVFGGVDNFSDELADGIRSTLDKIKVDAEK